MSRLEQDFKARLTVISLYILLLSALTYRLFLNSTEEDKTKITFIYQQF